MRICQIIIFFIILSFGAFGESTKTIEINKNTSQLFIVRDYVAYYEDPNNNLSINDILAGVSFNNIDKNTEDFTNQNKESAYWIRFTIKNIDSPFPYILELFDFNIDETDLYYFKEGKITKIESGSSRNFHSRLLYHKNPNFLINIPQKDSITYFMRFKSSKVNVLEPALRSIDEFYRYSILEYLMLGFFYGISCVIIGYNLVSYFIFKESKYVYYQFYIISMVGFLMSRNGTGFQFLWPNYPSFNNWIEVSSNMLSMCFLLLFIRKYQIFEKSQNVVLKAIYLLVLLNIVIIPLLVFLCPVNTHLVISIVYIHFIFAICLWDFIKYDKNNPWILLSFIVLDVGFVVLLFEDLGLIGSSILAVYAIYIAVNLQFIFISISILQNVRLLRMQKNNALNELLTISDKNQMMRILALKQQMSPHFIFNSLNSILQRIMSGNKEDASSYLVKLSKLIRKTLEQSDVLYVTLEEEIESLNIYLALEAMRLDQSISFKVQVDPLLSTSTSYIPSFIIQPFVENAIWHGLMPKDGSKKLSINVEKDNDYVVVTITDNGIGRTQSQALKIKNRKTSQGIKLITERLDLLNKKYNTNSTVEIIDLYDEDNLSIGTQVIIKTNFKHEQLLNSHNNR